MSLSVQLEIVRILIYKEERSEEEEKKGMKFLIVCRLSTRERD